MSDYRVLSSQVLEFKEITEALIKHFGHHDGYFDLGVGLNVGFGGFPGKEGRVFPGAAVVFEGLALNKVSELSGNAVDAAAVNPKSRAKKKS